METRTPPSTPQSARKVPKTPIDRGRRPPRLVLPTPGVNQANTPISFAPSGMSKISSLTSPYIYPRKESHFVTELKGFAKSGLSVGEKSTLWCYSKLSLLSKKWFTHCFLTIVLLIYSVGGALIFAAVEGRGENNALLDSRQKRYDLIQVLRELSVQLPNRTSDGEWAGKASLLLQDFEEEIIIAYESKRLIIANRGPKIWTFFNSVVYCCTIYTTIGYGHMYPTTITGQALTIVYAIIGIPLFLIALTDFGKLFTRAIKFVWSYVRRVYYTGSCRKVRQTTHMEEFFQGAQMMYEIATLRRPSMFVSADPNIPEEDPENPKVNDGNNVNSSGIGGDTPTTPAPSNFEIDDEFNLPISVAIFILVLYIFLGAVMYCILEGWDFFAAFYFVFISMSTIGFGDYVPRHPVCMIASIVYLVFGLALMSMCINVVQVKLSDTFKDASFKLGATIGLNVNSEDGSISTTTPAPVEVPEVHATEIIDENQIEELKTEEKGKKNKQKKSSMKVKTTDENDGENDDKPKTTKEVKF